ncbi:NUDIX hydrolase [Alteribacter populi]|uniref:NUDIX hydrolase n=1 Tax=Alteribacter populi TaxID=2011011 RepID=UPI000BBAC387|nr:NUDIX hydrolase [Alteribacter populi]
MEKRIETKDNLVYIGEREDVIVKAKEPQSVVVLAQDDNDIILIRQYRAPVDHWVIQLPGGGVETGEDLKQAARREFYEETGYQTDHLQYLGKLYPGSWISNEESHIYYSNKITGEGRQQLEDYEKIEVGKYDVNTVLQMFRDNELHDSELSFAILQAILRGYIVERK